jgi:hypothetical protein
LPVDGVVTIDEPVEESVCAVIGVVLSQRLYSIGIERVGRALLTVWRLILELVSALTSWIPSLAIFPFRYFQ